MDLLLVCLDRDLASVRVVDGLRLGRTRRCGLRFAVDETAVSKVHAEFRREGTTWRIIDLQTTNGTWLNDRRVKESPPLSVGDRIRLGQTGPLMELRAAGADATVYDAPAGLDDGTSIADPSKLPSTLSDADTPGFDDHTSIADPGKLPGPALAPGSYRPPRRLHEQDLTEFADEGVLRAKLQRERSKHHKTRQSLRKTSLGRRRLKLALAGTMLGASIAALLFVLLYEPKSLLEACQGENLSPELAALCRVPDLKDVIAGCIAKARAGDTDDPDCLTLSEFAGDLALAQADAYRDQFAEAVRIADEQTLGFGGALHSVLRRLGSEQVVIDALHPDFVAAVHAEVAYHTSPAGRAYAQQMICRKESCMRSIAPIFQEAGIDPIYAYISMQESRMGTYEGRCAKSPAGALGMWQFMSATAEDYGLTDRCNPEQATRAAAKHLQVLIRPYRQRNIEAPLLVLASYNAGSGRMGQRVRAVGAKEFLDRHDAMTTARRKGDFVSIWLHDRISQEPRKPGGPLTDETLGYVPGILGWAVIGEHPTAFGFDRDCAAEPACW